MLYEIYLITNTKTNKRYVGQVSAEKGFEKRFEQHIYTALHSKKRLTYLHNSIRHHGVENFSVKRLLKNIPEDQVDYYEGVCIKRFHTFYLDYPDEGYNMTRGGQGIHGYKHTVETKRKIATTNTGRKHTPETRAKMRRIQNSPEMIATHQTAQVREKLSVAAKKRFETEPGTFTGKHHTEETKNKIAAIHSMPIVGLNKETGEWEEFSSAMEASRYLISIGKTSNKSAYTRILTVCHQVKGQGKSAYGYIWKFKDVTTNPDECKDVD